MITEGQAINILNSLKADLSRFGHSVDDALTDGKVDAIEAVLLISQASQMGLAWYSTFMGLKDNLSYVLDVLDQSKFTVE
jgi:hypothetical protein